MADGAGSLAMTAPVVVDLPRPPERPPFAIERPVACPFVGREREMAELAWAVEEVLAGRPRVVLVAGEPGIGKSRTASEVAEQARRAGFERHWGRCHEAGGAPAYWPWVQVLRGAIGSRDPRALRAEIGAAADDVLGLLAVTQNPATAPSEPGHARFRFFDAIAVFLRHLASRRPLMIVLDDLHAADAASLLLLQFLADTLTEGRILVLAAYRDVGLGRDQPLWDTLGELARVEGVRRIELRGLGAADVARYIALTTGLEPPSGLVATVLERTEGNPFFVGEVVRLLVAASRLEEPEDGAPFVIPCRVREAVGRRLAHLSSACNEVLGTACVFGRHFALHLLEPVSGRSRAQLLEALEEAARARIVVADPRGGGRYAFSHVLVRDTLYDELNAADRARLHQRVCEVLEEFYRHDPEPHLDELAHHAFQAASGGAVDRAIGYAVYAGHRASRMLAYEEAARHYERALAALDLLDPVNQSVRCELWLALGEALTKAGRAEKARAAFLRAAEVARTRGDRVQLGRAALGLGGPWNEIGRVDEAHLELLREALETIDPGDSCLRALLMSRLARALYYADCWEERVALSTAALEMARRLGDPSTLGEVMNSHRFVAWDPGNVGDRLALATEAVRLADETGNRELALMGRTWRVVDLLELGEMARVRAEVEASSRLADELRLPYYRHVVAVFRGTIALLQGRFEEAERHAREALAIGRRVHPDSAAQIFAMQITGLRREQGRLAEMVPAVEACVARYPSLLAWKIGLAYVYADLGREAEARSLFAELAAKGFTDVPRDFTWTSAMSLLAEVCADLNDATHAALLYDILLPYDGQNVVLGYGWVAHGAIAHHLGRLAATMRRWDAAERHFNDALALNQRLGSRGYAAQIERAYVRILLARGAEGDRERALALLERMLATAHELGMRDVLTTGLALRERVLQMAAAGGPVAPAARAACVFRREGEYWTVGDPTAVVRLRDAKGLRYLAHLLARPGCELHSLDLVRTAEAGGEVPDAAERAVGADRVTASVGSAGPVLDKAAKASYRRRLVALRAEREEAERFNDSGRAARAREEIEALTEELARAVGLGGRDREAACDAERARLTVTKRVKSALAKIRQAHPALGHHLLGSVKTGYFCVYVPPPDGSVDWTL